jgi:hypothetical protein
MEQESLMLSVEDQKKYRDRQSIAFMVGRPTSAAMGTLMTLIY